MQEAGCRRQAKAKAKAKAGELDGLVEEKSAIQIA